MRPIRRFGITASAVLLVAPWAWADARLFVLRRDGDSLLLEAIELREGDARTWRFGEEGFIDVILPPGPGGSAGIAQTAMSPVTEARLVEGRLEVVTSAGGKRFDRPVPDAAARAATDIHVSARDASGASLAAFIRADARIEPDVVGVIEDPFGDAIPLQPGDCVIFTSTFASRAAIRPAIEGIAPMVFESGHYSVPASIQGGGTGRWVVDLAAGSTIVAHEMLPPGTPISPALSTQYSAEGVQRLAAEIGGATNAAAPLGYAVLHELRIGNVVFRDVEALVMEQMPPLAERVTGILGLDLLSRAVAVTLDFPAPGATGRLALGAPPTGELAGSTPIARLGSRSYCRGKVNGADVCFLIDTGAPRTILDVRAAEHAGVAATGEGHRIRGIGGEGASLRGGVAGSIAIGEAALADAPVEVGSLPLFSRFRGPTPVGILGNSTLSNFGAVTLDFENERLLLWNLGRAR